MSETVPDHPVSAKGGRPCANKRQVIEGIFWILDHGAKWKDLPSRYGPKSTVPRWFKRWVQNGVFEELMRAAGSLVEERNGFKTYECFIDGTFSKAKGGGNGVRCTKAGKGVKIMVDAKGLPMAAYNTSAGPHESKWVQRVLDFMACEQGPDRLIGDKAYDSDDLNAEMQNLGIEMIAPHHSNRRRENITQDGRSLRRYRRRWTVERNIGWLQHFRRLCVRWAK